MTGRIQAFYSVRELAEMIGVSQKHMRKILRNYGIEPVGAGERYQRIPLSQIREKIPAAYDSFKMADMYDEIMSDCR